MNSIRKQIKQKMQINNFYFNNICETVSRSLIWNHWSIDVACCWNNLLIPLIFIRDSCWCRCCRAPASVTLAWCYLLPCLSTADSNMGLIFSGFLSVTKAFEPILNIFPVQVFYSVYLHSIASISVSILVFAYL